MGLAKNVNAACWLFLGLAGLAPFAFAQDGPPSGPPPTAVRVSPARVETVQDGRLVTGQLRARQRSRVATREEGIVLDLTVQEGELVTPDTVIARLDGSRLRLALDETRAGLATTQAEIDERKAELDQAEANLAIVESLRQRDAANPKELLDMQSAVNISRARLAQSDARKHTIEAQIAILDDRLADMEIRPPFAGVVVATHIEDGEWLNQGDAVIEIISTDSLEAWLDVPQRYLAAVQQQPGSVSVIVEGMDEPLSGAKQTVIPLVTERARTFKLVVELDDSIGLAPGMSVQGWAPTGIKGDRMTVPKDAVLRNEGGFFVYAVRAMQPDMPPSAVPVPVAVLFARGDRFIVDAPGLSDHDLLVVEGNERLRPMAPLAPSPAEEDEDEADAQAASPEPSQTRGNL
ncbi:MAG: efflux RND transporter periplasmic adaptor subunit [Phycisphaerales bacterium]